MKVSTRIVSGYLVLSALLVSAIVYETILVHRVEEINRQLTSSNFNAALTVLRLRQTLTEVEEFALKHLLVGGAEYRDAFETRGGIFEESLEEMARSVRTAGEEAALERLTTTWLGFMEAIREVEAARPDSSYEFLPIRLEDQLRRMYSQIDVAYESTQSSINLELQRSAETATEAEQVSWITAVAALALSATVVFSIVRSISGSFSRLMDATRRISNERFAERIPEDRNDEFGELARSFNRMAGRLAELDQLKKNFVSSVSHELKSPIASSREIVQVLMEEIPGPLNPEQKRLLDLMGRSSGRLSSMVGSLLDVARMEAGTMSYEMRQVDVVSLVGSTLEEFEISLNERGLEATSDLPDGPLIVDCDKDRIVQVLGNLIDNAMKFSPRGSRIMVSIETGASGDRATALLSVVDFGPGVPDAHKERIFARFQQVQPQSGMNHGVGLGLAICRSIIDAHGGKIWVEDNPEGGSAFRVRLLQASSGPNPKNDSGGAPVKASA